MFWKIPPCSNRRTFALRQTATAEGCFSASQSGKSTGLFLHPELVHIYAATRVSDIKNKTVEQLRKLKEVGVNEISLGVESGDDWTLQRINKGYTSQDRSSATSWMRRASPIG